ncbi:MAG: Methyltransferase type 11 [Gemmatimonadetes bacterium]|nr:Methyltransferase type 11 [Gemmatimonadota bacterium]
MSEVQSALSAFRMAYGEHRAAEGRALDRDALLQLPYAATGPFARQWSVRARTFDAFVRSILTPLARRKGQPLRVLDVGAGNGWLSWHVSRAGHDCVALDVRDDDVDGLGAARPFLAAGAGAFERIAASFDALPLNDTSVDVVLFNASIHYAVDLTHVLREARRVARADGRIVILDSPFYDRAADGDAMVAEKCATAAVQFGSRSAALLSLGCIEYLTRDVLANASRAVSLEWTRHRVRYPLWYEARPLLAALRGRRTPSRFDMWEGRLA